MRIGVYHGYELTGSGSNEYTRYLARALAREGHDTGSSDFSSSFDNGSNENTVGAE